MSETGTRTRNTNEQFVTAYNSAESVEAVAEKLGIGVQSVRVRASNLKKAGVNLKDFPKKIRGITQEEVQRLNSL